MYTANDVAKKAGVSTMTVSRVMNEHSSVADKTRRRVLEVAKELNYRPNLIARSLVTKKTNTIGVLMTSVENPIYSVFLSAILDEAKDAGYDVIISGASALSTTTANLASLVSKGVDGIIVLPLEFRELDSRPQGNSSFSTEIQTFEQEFEKIIRHCYHLKLPVVFLGSTKIKEIAATVHINYYQGSKQAVTHVVNNNHKKIGYLHHHILEQGLWGQRYHGFRDAMAEHGLPLHKKWMMDTEDTVDSSQKAMETLLNTNTELPTVIVCSNDKMAVGALNALIKHNIKVPDELSLIGHDGSYISEITYPKLTTISIQPKKVGASCFRALLNSMKPGATYQDFWVDPLLITGGTVRKL